MTTPQASAIPLIKDLTTKRGYRFFNPATDTLGLGDNVVQGVADGAITIGSPVYPTATGSDTVAMGQANAANPSCILGVACNAAADTEAVGYVVTGPWTMTTAEWDAIIDGVAVGGLVKGETYYLSDANAGGLIPSADLAASGLANPDNLVLIGSAATAGTMLVNVEPPIQL